MEKARMGIYALAGIYLLFLAYNLAKGVSDSTGIQQVLVIGFTIIFAAIGITALVLTAYKTYKMSKKDAK